MNKSESIKEIANALVKAQTDMRGAKKASSNPFFKSKYADLSEVIDVARKPLQDNGLSFSQFPISEEGMCGVETILMHISGEWISQKLLLATAKQDPQAYGSAITYARRYSLQAILGIPSEDDDGNGATFQTSTSKAPVKSQTHSSQKTCECGKPITGNFVRCYSCNKNRKEVEDMNASFNNKINQI